MTEQTPKPDEDIMGELTYLKTSIKRHQQIMESLDKQIKDKSFIETCIGVSMLIIVLFFILFAFHINSFIRNYNDKQCYEYTKNEQCFFRNEKKSS